MPPKLSDATEMQLPTIAASPEVIRTPPKLESHPEEGAGDTPVLERIEMNKEGHWFHCTRRVPADDLDRLRFASRPSDANKVGLTVLWGG